MMILKYPVLLQNQNQKMAINVSNAIQLWQDSIRHSGFNLKGQGFTKQTMDKELEVAGKFDQMNKVVEELLKGNTPTNIARSLELTRVQVENHIKTWKEMVHDNTAIRERAKEALAGADEHYNMLIKEAWRTLEQADAQDALAIKTQSLKLIADIEGKRIEMLNKAGVLENSDIGDQILESEKKQQILVDILRDVTANCDHCKWEVAKRLQEVTGQVEAVQVD